MLRIAVVPSGVRRPRELPVPDPSPGGQQATELLVATLNLRNIADRWPERISLLLADMSALQPDLIGLQECVFAVQQDRILGAAGEGRYESRRGWAGRPEYGNALLGKAPIELGDAERLDLGRNRSALRVPVAASSGTGLDFVVTHLHHLVPDESAREEQAQALAAWLADAEGPLVVVGDFNAEPSEPAYAVMGEAGFRSAHAEANGAEPASTWPSGIQAPGMDTDGEPGCLDYVWVRGPITVAECSLAFDRPAVDDPTLYPSDHFGLKARIRVGA
jgi:endonuclease/exonuclease/phosphatase family metal-dependent hydrolase